jgi:hypothetical protein
MLDVVLVDLACSQFLLWQQVSSVACISDQQANTGSMCLFACLEACANDDHFSD